MLTIDGKSKIVDVHRPAGDGHTIRQPPLLFLGGDVVRANPVAVPSHPKLKGSRVIRDRQLEVLPLQHLHVLDDGDL